MIYIANSNTLHTLTYIIDTFDNVNNINIQYPLFNKRLFIECGYYSFKSDPKNIHSDFITVVDSESLPRYFVTTERTLHHNYINQIHKLLRVNSIKHILTCSI